MAAHVYHWKHGWIPLDHVAAMKKAKGNRLLAQKYLADAKGPEAGINSRQHVAKAALEVLKIEDPGDRSRAMSDVKAAAAKHGGDGLLPDQTAENWSKKRTAKYVIADLDRQSKDLTEDDVATLTDYVQNGAFDSVNAHLRGVEMDSSFADFNEGDVDPASIEQFAREMDSAIQKSVSMNEMTLYRGVEDNAASTFKHGSVITDNGFMSTTLDPTTANEFGKNIMRITYPWNRHALHVDGVEDLSLGQSEVILPRGLTMKITSIKTTQDGKRLINVQVQ